MFTEKRIWSWLKADVPKYVLLQRLECTYPPGVPDVICCSYGVVTFIELKKIVRGRIRLSPQQSLFIKKWISHRGRSLILGADEKKDLYLLYPTDNLLVSGKVTRQEIAFSWQHRKGIWRELETFIN